MLIILLEFRILTNKYTLTSLCGPLNNGALLPTKTTMQSPKESASVSPGFKPVKSSRSSCPFQSLGRLLELHLLRTVIAARAFKYPRGGGGGDGEKDKKCQPCLDFFRDIENATGGGQTDSLELARY
jgi:hypothetical protein